MRVVVRHLWSCEPELDRWVESLPGNDPERRALARMHLELLDQRMIDFVGVPPGAEEVPGLSPRVYWWESFPGGGCASRFGIDGGGSGLLSEKSSSLGFRTSLPRDRAWQCNRVGDATHRVDLAVGSTLPLVQG